MKVPKLDPLDWLMIFYVCIFIVCAVAEVYHLLHMKDVEQPSYIGRVE